MQTYAATTRRFLSRIPNTCSVLATTLLLAGCPSSHENKADAGVDATAPLRDAEPEDVLSADGSSHEDGGTPGPIVETVELDFGPQGAGGGAFSDPRLVYPAMFSPDGQQLVLVARSLPEDRASGLPVTVRFLTLQPEVQKTDVSLPFVPEQMAYTPDGAALILVSRDGTRLSRLDTATGTVSTLWESNGAATRYKLYPVLWQASGSLFTLARVFDDTGLLVNTYQVLEVDPIQGTVREIWSYDRVFSEHGVVYAFYPAGRDQVAFASRMPDGQEQLFLADSSGRARSVDTAAAFGGLAASAQGDILYVKRDETGRRELHFFDGTAGSSQEIAVGDYAYPFLSSDGNRGLVIAVNGQGRSFSVFTWSRSDGIHTAGADLQQVPFGPMKLSPDGSRFVYFGPGRLVIGHLHP